MHDTCTPSNPLPFVHLLFVLGLRVGRLFQAVRRTVPCNLLPLRRTASACLWFLPSDVCPTFANEIASALPHANRRRLLVPVADDRTHRFARGQLLSSEGSGTADGLGLSRRGWRRRYRITVRSRCLSTNYSSFLPKAARRTTKCGKLAHSPRPPSPGHLPARNFRADVGDYRRMLGVVRDLERQKKEEHFEPDRRGTQSHSYRSRADNEGNCVVIAFSRRVLSVPWQIS